MTMNRQHNGANRSHSGGGQAQMRFAGDVFLHAKNQPDPPMLRRHTADEAYKHPPSSKPQSEVSI